MKWPVSPRTIKRIKELYALLHEEYDGEDDKDLIVSIIRDIGRTFGYRWSIQTVKSVIR